MCLKYGDQRNQEGSAAHCMKCIVSWINQNNDSVAVNLPKWERRGWEPIWRRNWITIRYSKR